MPRHSRFGISTDKKAAILAGGNRRNEKKLRLWLSGFVYKSSMSIVDKENQSTLIPCGFRRSNHAKDGQFGQSLLNLNSEVIGFNLRNNNRLIIDCRVENIPHTKKRDFIETWINVHDIYENQKSDITSNQESPIIGSTCRKSKKQLEKSPVFESRSKRSTRVRSNDNLICVTPKRACSSPHTIDLTTSPILKTYPYNRKRRKLFHSVQEDSLESSEQRTTEMSPVRWRTESVPQIIQETPNVEIEWSDDDEKEHTNPIDCESIVDNDRTRSDLIEELCSLEIAEEMDKHKPLFGPEFEILEATCHSEESTEIKDVKIFQGPPSFNFDINHKLFTQKLASLDTSTSVINHDDSSCVSEKKTKKHKKGSLVSKLHSLLSSQAGHVRLWHHRTKRAESENILVPCVILSAENICISFNRYFIRSTIEDDSHQLLSDCSSKSIVIMIVPDGIDCQIDIKPESILKIYPPWDILGHDKDIIRVTYFKLISSDGIGIQRIKKQIVREEQITSREFDCMCITRNQLTPLCPSKHEKPNVMKHLFNF